MSSRTLALVEPGQLDLADLDRLDLSLPACCRPQAAPHGPRHRAISLIVAISMAARAAFVPVSNEMSFGDYMDEAYHEMICGNGPRHAIDPVIFAQIKGLLIPIAQQKQQEDEQKGKFQLDNTPLPPPAPIPAPCCSGQATSFILRRRGQHLVPA